MAKKKPKASLSSMRRFVLSRKEDVSGTSGEGIVAEGVMFSNGRASLHWLTQLTSIAIYDNMETLDKIHGHDGRTEVVWIDA